MSTTYPLPTPLTARTRRLAAPVLVLAAAVLAACVTINVYFPAAAAEKAADRIIEQVYGGAGSPAPSPAPAPSGRSSSLAPADTGSARAPFAMPSAADAAVDGLRRVAARALDWVVPAAHAQAPDLNVSTPAIRSLVASMEARHATLAPHYASGAIGPTDEGVLEIRDQNAIPLAERTAVRKLVADENADRTALYAEIARANGNPAWTADIRNIFARRWIDKAQPGWWFRSGGSWQQK